jgi:hypothetical protein
MCYSLQDCGVLALRYGILDPLLAVFKP